MNEFEQREANENHQELIEDCQESIRAKILGGHAAKVGDDYYEMSDFNANVEIDDVFMAELMQGNCLAFMEDMEEKFDNWTLELATKIIDKGE